MVPNWVCSAYPPANGGPPRRVWHAAQCPAAESISPLAIDSAGKLARLGGSMGAIAGRHAKRKKLSSPRAAAATIAIATRRINESSSGSGSALKAAALLGTGPHIVDYQKNS